MPAYAWVFLYFAYGLRASFTLNYASQGFACAHVLMTTSLLTTWRVVYSVAHIIVVRWCVCFTIFLVPNAPITCETSAHQWSRKHENMEPLPHSPFQSSFMDQHAIQNKVDLEFKIPMFTPCFRISILKRNLQFFGNPSSCRQTATWHLGSDTTISGDITCKDEMGVVVSAHFGQC